MPHLDAVYSLARWLTRDVNDAEDVVQDACVRALKYLDAIDPEQALLRNTEGKALADAYADGEVDALRNYSIEKHLHGCAGPQQ